MVLAILFLLGLPARAACPASTTDLRAAIDQGVEAYESWDWEHFGLAVADVDALLGCLAEPLSPKDAAQVHLFGALQAGVKKDEARATVAFQSLLALDPAFELPQSLGSPGSLLRRAYEAARAADVGESVRLHDEGWIVDGQPAARRLPLSRPALVQRLGDDGLQTWVVSGQPLPDPLELATARPAPRPAVLGLGVASGVSLALGALSFVAARHTSSAYPDAGTPEEAARLNALNHASFLGGAGLGAAGLGLGVSAVIIELRR